MVYALHHLLTETVGRHPERMAVWARGEQLTYAELERRSNQLAHLLRDCGVQDGDRVGLHASKSVHSIVAMLGTLKAGAAYVPIDPRAPAKRVDYIIRNCGIRRLIADRARIHHLENSTRSEIATILLCETADTAGGDAQGLLSWSTLDGYPSGSAPDRPTIETDLAYILYTSGSTGHPKGVVLTHRNALTFVNWCADTFAISHEDRLSNHAPFHFDLSVFDVYNAIEAGASVFLVHEDLGAFPNDLVAFIETHQLTVWYSVPSALIYLLLHGNLAARGIESLRLILFAGEVFPMKYLRELAGSLPKAELYNLYGPTETNVCTYYRVDRERLGAMERLPIGRACANTQVFALTEAGALAKPGEVGELYARGPSVTPGYWGDLQKSRSAVVPNPIQTSYDEVLYRTGDLVVEDSAGDYDFVGRRDSMVKSRGYRIELGEVESAIYGHPGVKEAAVVAIPDETVGNRLKAVIVPHGPGALTREEIESHCAKSIPSYMIPEFIEFSDRLPKTSSGKTDRVKLVESTTS